MNPKIKWYREVLELEPSSKVFFPLAKLLTEEGSDDQAVDTLREGLSRHPEHFEAKLLLVDLLSRDGADKAEVVDQVADLAARMAEYPAFWEQWANVLANRQLDQDAALAVRFLAAALGGGKLTWTLVIAKGLEALAGGGDFASAISSAMAPVQEAHHPAAQSVKAAKPAAPVASEPEQELFEAAEEIAASDRKDDEEQDGVQPPYLDDMEQEDSGFTEIPDVNPVRESAMRRAQTLAAAVAISDTDDDDEHDEVFSTRTRTMAELLAEQGDYSGAVEIYRELIESSPEGVISEHILERMDELQAMASGTHPKKKAKDADDGGEGAMSSHSSKLMTTLEALAKRLESRAAR